jgi:molybdate transport system substrate-binding protein
MLRNLAAAMVVLTMTMQGAQIVALPDELAVGADYGLTVIANASSDAYRFAMAILSGDAQGILAKYGFSAPTLPQ